MRVKENDSQKKVWIAIADKILLYFKPKNGNKRDKYGYYIKRAIRQEYITVNIYAPNIGKPKYKSIKPKYESIKYEQIYKEKLSPHK